VNVRVEELRKSNTDNNELWLFPMGWWQYLAKHKYMY